MHVNIIARDRGAGLGRDAALIAGVLEAHGAKITASLIGGGKLRKWFGPWQVRARRGRRFDINLMLEHIRPEYLHQAGCNLLMPNPEWFDPRDEALLPRVDGVLAKTRHAEAIFRQRGCQVAYTGFTSDDCRIDRAVRAPGFVHLPGRSGNKGTQAVLDAWRAHPEWPRLTVVQNPRVARERVVADNVEHVLDYLDTTALRRLQNAHRFHLCPSETEGFGHYLVEALSIGALALTTDAAPMNELVDDDRGVLVTPARTGRQRLASTHHVDVAGLERAVAVALALDEAECARRAANARAFFESNDRQFRQCLPRVLAEWLGTGLRPRSSFHYVRSDGDGNPHVLHRKNPRARQPGPGLSKRG